MWIAIAVGAAVGGTTTAIQGGSIGDIFLSAAISGAAAGVGFGTFGPVAEAATAAGYSTIGAGIIGGVAAGAAAGLTSGVLSTAAGYKVNIGQAVGIGALSGGISGGIGGTVLDLQYKILASSVVSGGIAELTGGNFAVGFSTAVITSSLSHFYRNLRVIIEYMQETGDFSAILGFFSGSVAVDGQNLKPGQIVGEKTARGDPNIEYGGEATLGRISVEAGSGGVNTSVSSTTAVKGSLFIRFDPAPSSSIIASPFVKIGPYITFGTDIVQYPGGGSGLRGFTFSIGPQVYGKSSGVNIPTPNK